MEFFDVAQVLAIVLGQVNGVMRDVVITSFNPQVEHEGGAGKALLLDPAVGPATADIVGHHALHGLREIGIHHDRIGGQSAIGGAHRGALAALKHHLFDWLVEQDLRAQIFRNASHGPGDCTATAHGMKNAVLIFEEREDAEQTRASKGRHTEILGLEAESQAYALIFEIAFQVRIKRVPWTKERQQFQHVELGQISPAFERLLQERRELFKFVAVVTEEAMEATSVFRAQLRDGALHTLQVWCCQQFAARAEDQAVLRIEAVHRDFFIQVPACGSKYFAQYLGVKEKGWPGIELETVLLHGRCAATDDLASFHYGYVDARSLQQNSSGESSRTGPDNDDLLIALAHSIGEMQLR